ncbi:PAS domain S-box-containing protein [Desulfocicer vacuolatum DSM 3385]|uniref:PAS domain S-box-containing protein n=1 Tax=Desulfocicer vacuolatum DSM 3385 TaxID=1121400 RepID=A0A1W2DCM5_9BACT|nr:sigma 54-interacting transcriptional regulator [Desulfocicer vacuolatum]SMC94728.1 PAS domain S-box-containing protein [Desulfocicer vacuolatum DSM 3385]
MDRVSPPRIQGLMNHSLDFCAFLDDLPLGIVILDLNFRIVFVNHVFEALTGYSASDARGIPCCHIVRSRECGNGCPGLLTTHGKSSSCVESDIISRDRRRLPVRISLAPLLDESGHSTGYIETIENIRAIKEDVVKRNKAYSFSDIVGRSPQMERIFQTVPILAQSDTSILITGETGTGKDLVAEAIHQTSTRAAGPFIKINCGALPETLLESEIFGHLKGAFTGAVENKPGRFQLAHNGTIFLTEIGDLPIPLQVKLLTFLDDKVIYPLGSTKGFNADVRMIAATHRDLETMVTEKRFRQDLFFRLNVARIHLPPLREREGDVRLLLDHFVNLFSIKLNKKNNRFTSEALAILGGYAYAGNIRELRNIVEYAVNMAGEKPIEPEHLPAYLFDEPPSIVLQGHGDPPPPSLPPTGGGAAGNPGRTWANAEREMILDAMVRAKGRKQVAADLLGWGRSTLWRKMKQYEIQ